MNTLEFAILGSMVVTCHFTPIAFAAVVISPSSFDFGEVSGIERPVLTATLRNDGERTVHVTDVIRTCVCANLELSATNLPPGGSAEVRCTVDPNANAPAVPAPHAESAEGAKEPAP